MVIVGVDVSKATLDISLMPAGTCLQIENKVNAFRKWYRSLIAEAKDNSVLVVMEHTGRYSTLFETFLRSKEMAYCKIPALQIKRSIGIIRGKADKIDARRIAEYGWLRREVLIADTPLSNEIVRLRELLSLRSKIVRDRSGYINRLKEIKSTGPVHKDLEKMQGQIIDTLTRHIKSIEAKIKQELKSTTAIYSNYCLLTSITGIGFVVAVHMICSTGNFTRFTKARKFNCYAGIAPFPHESGTSIKARSRISHLANKEIKTLLNLSACSAIRCDAELKEYYQRRLKEGKRKMSCVNIIRAKLVARIFAVIQRQTPYQPLQIAA